MDAIMVYDVTEWDADKSKKFNKLYRELESDYSAFIDTLGREFEESDYWWFTVTASRNILLSNALYDITLLLMVLEEIDLHPEIRSIIVPSKYIAKDLKNQLQGKGSKIHIAVRKNREHDRKFDFFNHVVLRRLYFHHAVSKFLKDFIINNKLANTYRDKDDLLSDDYKDVILILMDVFSNNFSNGEFTARDFENILEFTDKKVIFMPYLVSNSGDSKDELVKQCLESKKYRFLLREEFVDSKDLEYVRGFQKECLMFSKTKKFFRGVDVTNILKSDIMRSAFNHNCYYGIINSRIFYKLKEKGIEIKRLVDWYEGQPSSLGAILGFHRAYGGKTAVGYIGMAIEETNIAFFPTKLQSEVGVAPDKYAVIGRSIERIYQKKSPEAITMLAPPFRLQGFFKKPLDKAAGDKEYKARKKILLSLSYKPETSVKLVKTFIDCKEYLREKNVKVLIKEHPTVSGRDSEFYGLNNIGFEYEFINGNYRSAVDKVDLVVSPKSSVGYETVLYGKPVIVTYFDGLSYTCMPEEWDGRYFRTACDKDELLEGIKFFLENEITALNVVQEDEYLVRTSRETVDRLLTI